MFSHIKHNFIEPLLCELTNAEHEIEKFPWNFIFGDGNTCRTKLTELWALIERLHVSRQSTSAYWIERVLEHCPNALHNEFFRSLRGQDKKDLKTMS